MKLAALRDAVQLAPILLTVSTLSITVLPALLTTSDNNYLDSRSFVTMRYTVCSVAAMLALFATVSLLFIPKVSGALTLC